MHEHPRVSTRCELAEDAPVGKARLELVDSSQLCVRYLEHHARDTIRLGAVGREIPVVGLSQGRGDLRVLDGNLALLPSDELVPPSLESPPQGAELDFFLLKIAIGEEEGHRASAYPIPSRWSASRARAASVVRELSVDVHGPATARTT